MARQRARRTTRLNGMPFGGGRRRRGGGGLLLLGLFNAFTTPVKSSVDQRGRRNGGGWGGDGW